MFFTPKEIKNTVTTNRISSISLYNFRNYHNSTFHFNKNKVVILGENGIGKTNILEAISLFSPGKGLKNSKIEDLISTTHEKNQHFCFHLNINYFHHLGDINLTTKAIIKEEKLKKVFLLDENPIKNSDKLTSYLTLIWYTPQLNLEFFADKSFKRKFLDRLIFNYNSTHLNLLLDYEKLLKERTLVLKQNISHKWLNHLEEALAEKSSAITINRFNFLNKLNLIIQSSFNVFSKIDLSLDGEIESIMQNNYATQAEDKIKELLKQNRVEDERYGGSKIGIHKTNFQIKKISNNILDKNSSTGEQKMMLITIILAFTYLTIVDKSIYPTLLLDEVFTHLDSHNQILLLNKLLELNCSFFTTNTIDTPFLNYKNELEFLHLLK